MPEYNASRAALDLLKNGNFKAALKATRAGATRDPRSAIFPNVIGIALCGLGKHADSLPHFERALHLNPAFDEAHRNIAQTLLTLGRPQRALKHLGLLARKGRGDADTTYLMARALWETGDTAGAMAAAERSIVAAPRNPRAYFLMAQMREMTEGPLAAIAEYDRLLGIAPNDPEAMLRKSLPLARTGAHAQALALVRTAVSIRPKHAATLLRYATMLNEIGDIAAARQTLQTILADEPAHALAMSNLVHLQDEKANKALFPALQTVFRKSQKGSENQIAAGFALARIARQQDDADGEARWLAKANALEAARVPYDPARDRQMHHDMAARFPTPFPPAPDCAAPDRVPVFVVGLPRSGTSLTEAMLGNHPDIVGLGELAAAGYAVQKVLEGPAPFDAETFAHTYLAALPALPEGVSAFVDKMPENYRILGFLLGAFPQARIIHMRRDPRDVALSMWRTRFAGTALSYTSDLSHIALRMNLYAEMMQHWQRILPGRILGIDYAALVSDPLQGTRDMAAFIGLPWHADMVRPEDNKAPVQTASVNQVREPVHSRALGRWKSRRDVLAPFVAALDPALWPDLRDD